MTWHPLTLALIVGEILFGVVYLVAAVRMFFILPAWQPSADHAGQLARERVLQLTVYQGRWAVMIQAAGFVLLVAGISNLWPPHVPGAMCGMGVMQALGPAVRQALAFKAATLAVLCCWQAVLRVEGRMPEPTAIEFHGRLLLLALPFWALGAWSLASALGRVKATAPVSCCAAVYDQALASGGGVLGPVINAVVSTAWGTGNWVIPAVLAAVVIAAWGLWIGRRPDTVIHRLRLWPLAIIGTGLPVVYMVVTRAVAPYVLEVRHHPCPWCLFLGEHMAVGAVFFGLPAWVAVEGLVAVALAHMARCYPTLAPHAAQRIRRSGWRIFALTLLLGVVLAAPALWWYARFGGWIG